MNITAQTEDSASPVWMDIRQVASQPVSLDTALTTTYFGTDYRLGSEVLIGAMVQRADRSTNPLIDGEGTTPDAYLTGPYAAYRLSPNLVLGARAAWGETSDVTTSDNDQQSFTKSRLLTETRLSGNWALGKWQLMPAASITYVDDNAVSVSGPSDTMVQTTRLTAGPQIRRQFDAGDAGSLEPFAFFKTSLDLDSLQVAPSAARNTIGGGVALNQPDGYSIQATANFSETLGTELPDAEVAGKVSLSMPLQ